MKRKATKFMALAISTVLVISLMACGDGNGGEVEDVVTPVEAQPMLSELELEILNLETKYNKGEFTGADYLWQMPIAEQAISASNGICWNRITGFTKMRMHFPHCRASV